FKNNWNAGIVQIYRPNYLDERLTRGGPTVSHYGYKFLGFDVRGDSRSRLAWGFNFNYVSPVGSSEGGRIAYYPSLTFKPSPSINVSVSPSWDHDYTAQQFVKSFNDANAPVGFGGVRYVFGRLEQKTFAVNTRVNATFTPNLTLELFAQPFLASGHYTSFKEFAKPKSGDMTYYGGTDNSSTIVTEKNANGSVSGYRIDPDGGGAAAPFTVANPDFNIRSLRGTAVMRWEYRPGSTLFFVWTQQREGFDALGDFDFNRDRSALFRDRPTNIFQIKATYWLGR
ncbi:MAG TPA: DUF5916 domain-containing protein, partial [Gemmatimonadaceae bacterium]|nr:DUF5916 domain-containing protein [Gemmatimonadaceae bacterium]